MQAFPKSTSHFSTISTNHKDSQGYEVVESGSIQNQGTALDGWSIGNLYIKLQDASMAHCAANGKPNWLPLLGLDETSIRLRDPCLPSSAATTHATRAEVLGIPVSSVKSHQLAAGQDKVWRLIRSHEILRVDDLSSDMEHDMVHTSSVFQPAAAHSFLHHAWPPCSIDLGVAEYILKERTSSVTFPQDMETGLPTTLTLSSVIEKAAKIPHSCTVRSS